MTDLSDLPASLEVSPDGSVTTPTGWAAGTAACGLRSGSADDLALVVADRACTAAGVFTKNRVAAAPVEASRKTLESDSQHIRAVVINAGVANACTGSPGLAAARDTQEAAADAIGCRPGQILVMSTGLIGAVLDIRKVRRGIVSASSQLSGARGVDAAQAIMTTDKVPKYCSVQVHDAAGSYSLGGVAKGAGMIHPNMATMLALITTDAQVPSDTLQAFLATAVDRSFHRISVDGDTSTNDTVLLLANGASGVQVDWGSELFRRALQWICQELALAIVSDGEGASRLIQLHITGARSEGEALQAARSIATSPLVKTAVAGGDPNWGRILAAAGRSGAQLDPERLRLWVGSGPSANALLVRDSVQVSEGLEAAKRAFSEDELYIRLDLCVGEAQTTFWTTDLTHEYVSINAEYHT